MLLLSFATPSSSLFATGPIEPAVLYNFEDVRDPTIDAKGLCNLSFPMPAFSTAKPQVQDGDAHSVGNFLVFDYGAPALPANRTGLTWYAQSCAPRSIAKGVTIEFLLHPTPQCFLRGGSTRLIGTTQAGLGIALDISYSGLTFTALTADDALDGDDGVLHVPFVGEGVLAADYLWSDTSPQGR